jgi:dihydrofolate synthase/folylpolyglutamate synthase
MNYTETLEYLFRQLPMYQRVGQAAYKTDLDGTNKLMKVLGHPQRGLRCIHVAGTNGKGSVSHLLASVLQEAGMKVGLYTSPHLVDFRERIRINGAMIPKAEVVSFVDTYKEQFESIGLSFFEWTVGLAFHHFRTQEVDVAVVEVGMGGRLDSTNVVTPDLSVITNIDLDHTQFLGDTLAKIAKEKAGIIKKGRPVVVGRSQRETEGIFRSIALQLDAPIAFADQQFPMDAPASDLQGPYQSENFLTALISIDELRRHGYDIPSEAVDRGFASVKKNTGLRGRWEVLQENPRVICDVGHNEEGLKHTVQQLEKISDGNLYLILGFVSDKDVKKILSLFPKGAKYHLTAPTIPRAFPLTDLSEIATDMGIKHDLYHQVKDAYSSMMKEAGEKDTVFVGGSTFVVADLLAFLA